MIGAEPSRDPSRLNRLGSSLRDPAGFLARYEGRLLRVVGESGSADLDLLERSGLYARLVERKLLIPHQDVPVEDWPEGLSAARVIQPAEIPFVSHAFEWCPGQLRDAALVTLAIQHEALGHGMTLKDASTSNIQFLDGRPALVDTLSLVRNQGEPWVAYFQFCKQFLGPLLLAHHRDASILQWMESQTDGIPLDMASALLPRHSWLRPSALLHIHLHARASQRASGASSRPAGLSPARADAVVESLRHAVEGLEGRHRASPWTSYEHERPTYSDAAWSARQGALDGIVSDLAPRSVWDLGAATGHLTRTMSVSVPFVLALDSDAACVERIYRWTRQERVGHVLPLVMNLLNPTPDSGWAGEERVGLLRRGPADLAVAMGLVHHLAVPGGVPFERQFEVFARLAGALVVEFIGRDDPMVRAWSNRFPTAHLTEEAFAAAAAPHFDTLARIPLPESGRVLYRLVRR